MAEGWITHKQSGVHDLPAIVEDAENLMNEQSLSRANKYCEICGRAFGRTEHRARHMLIHTRDKPYVCPLCGNQFQRADVLRRHITKYCHRLEEAASREKPLTTKSRTRVMIACDNCHKKKIKCNGEVICRNCASSGFLCKYERKHQRRCTQSFVSRQNQSTLTPLSPVSEAPSNELQNRDRGVTHESTASMSARSTTQPEDPMFKHLQLQPPTGHEIRESPIGSEIPSQFTQPDHSTHMWSVDDIYDQTCQIDFTNGSNPLLDFNLTDANTDYSAWLSLDDIGSFNIDMEMNPLISLEELSNADHLQEGLKTFKQAVSGNAVPPNTLQEQLDSWLRCPLIPRQYDLDMLEALIQIFQRHFSPVFASLQGLEISSHTLVAQIIAMAALGALFTDIDGSAAIARLLFTDSQRMLTNIITTDSISTLGASTSLIHTHMCLELFGLCSGHKRSNEVSEAFHSALIQAVVDHQSWLKHASPSDLNSACQIILLDVIVLEGYRVTLLQLQPILLPSYFDLIQSLVDTLERGELNQHALLLERCSSYHQLASICAFAWFAIDRTQGVVGLSAVQSWRPEFIELCFQRFADTSQTDLGPSMKILMFTSLLNLHAPVEMYHDLAFSYTQKDPGTNSGTSFEHLKRWQESENFDLSLEYAKEVLKHGETIISSTEIHETPHDAICVYIATLTFWASCLTGQGSCDDRQEVASHAEKGAALLSRFKVKVASVMHQILVLLSKE